MSAITENTWQLVHERLTKPMTVAGFQDQANARRHALKHFLSLAEHWEEFHTSPSARELRAELARAGYVNDIDTYPELMNDSSMPSVLERAAIQYVLVCRKATSWPNLDRVCHLPKSREIPFRSILVLSRLGILSVFVEGVVSHLATSYRPHYRGMYEPGQFYRAARRKFEERTKVLCGCKGASKGPASEGRP